MARRPRTVFAKRMTVIWVAWVVVSMAGWLWFSLYSRTRTAPSNVELSFAYPPGLVVLLFVWHWVVLPVLAIGSAVAAARHFMTDGPPRQPPPAAR